MKKLLPLNKIAVRLTLYFSVVLLLFAIFVGGMFAHLFEKHTIELHQNEMQVRAEHLATMAANAVAASSGQGQEQPRGRMSGMGGGMGMHHNAGTMDYMRLLAMDDFGDAWIVDENMNLLMPQGHMRQYAYRDLPPEAEQVVAEAFRGKAAFSRSFSSLLGLKAMTVGVPIHNPAGKTIGVVLLHSAIDGINEATRSGIFILLASMGAAMLLAFSLAVVFSYAFTRPLKRMKTMAAALAEGDYTSRTGVKSADEIGDLAATLDILSQQLLAASLERDKLDTLRKTFIANISHELRTPVTVLRGSLEALCDKVVEKPEEVAQYQQEMLTESIYLQRLVDDLLELSRLQNPEFRMEYQTTDLCAVIRDAARLGRKLAQEKNIVLQTEIVPEVFFLQADYARFRQLLIILLDNAVKFSTGDTVSLTFRENTIAVTNEGPPIAPEELPYLFERFYKNRNEENRQGTGLGLAIARQIAGRHDIAIEVACSDGKTTFSLRLPASTNL